jgi:hypothetical protein
MTFGEFKEKVLRPIYLPAAFALGALTLGLRTATINYDFGTDVSAAARAPSWLRPASCYELASRLRDTALLVVLRCAPGRMLPAAAVLCARPVALTPRGAPALPAARRSRSSSWAARSAQAS